MEDYGLHAEGIASCSAGVTWGYRRRSFVGELPRWGGGAVMDLPVEPAVAGGIGGSVFPAASAGMMAGAPTAAGSRGAAPAVAGSIGGSVFPAASAGMMAGAPAAAGTRGAGSAPAVVGGFGGNVFPAASAGMMAGAPAAAGSRGAAASAPAVVGGFGGNVFPAESVGMMAGTPAAAGSSGATFQAASSAVRPPSTIAFASDDHEDYQVRRMLVGSCFCAVILASFSACVILFSTVLYLDKTADDYPAVENHRGGVVLVMRL